MIDQNATYITNSASITYINGNNTCIYYSDYPAGGLLESTEFINSTPGDGTTPEIDHWQKHTCELSVAPYTAATTGDNSDLNFFDITISPPTPPVINAFINYSDPTYHHSIPSTYNGQTVYNVDFSHPVNPHSQYYWDYYVTMTFYGQSYSIHEGKLIYTNSSGQDLIINPFCTPENPISHPLNGKTGVIGNNGQTNTNNVNIFNDPPSDNGPFWVFSTLGINQKQIDNIKFSIIPNPAKDRIFITFTDKAQTNYNYKIISMSSQTVMNGTFKSVNGENNIELNVDKLSKGEYSIEINSLNTKFITKFIIN